MAPGARNYVFTLWSDEHNEDGSLEAPRMIYLEDLPNWITYMVYQLELCPDTARYHFQGYLECLGQQTMVRIEALDFFVGCCRLAVRRGTQTQAIAYAMKEDTRIDGPWEFGEKKEQGKRSDLLEVKDKIDRKRPLVEIQQENFVSFARHSRFFKEYKRQITPKRDFKTIVVLIVGPSGVGKSRFAQMLCNMLGSVYKVPMPKGSGLYWDDYDGQDVTWIDEMDGNYMSPTFFNTLADRYECVVPVHGGAGHQFASKYLIICSNYLPKYWWKKRRQTQLVQTMRRIDVLIPLVKLSLAPVMGLMIDPNFLGRKQILGNSINYIP